MNYAEAAYFDGNHCAHVAAWQDMTWLRDRRRRATAAFEGR